MTAPLRHLLAYASVLHVTHLPWVMILAIIGAACLSLVLPRMRPHVRVAVGAGYAIGAVALMLLLGFDWWQGEFLVSTIAVAGWLKLGEIRHARDGLLVWISALWTLAMAALWLSPGAALLTVLPGLALGLFALARLEGPLATRRMLGQVALALPLMSVFFVFTPRITGDLGTLSFALGIPLIIETEAEKRRDPMQDGLAMGDIANRASDTDMRVLVASFYGGGGGIHDGAPPLGDLYWRGPVLWTYQDGQWHGREGWENRTARMRGKITHKTLKQELRETGQISVYDVRLFPHRGHWLYALDFPAAVPPSSFITKDYQLQNLNPVREILHYPMMSYLDYRAGPALDATTRTMALQFPPGTNPRTLALGETLAAEYADPVARAKAGMAHFREGYAYDQQAGGYNGADAVDAFLFDRRRGYAGHFATAYTLVMRAAGVPARLVVGYRGGVHLGLTNQVYVMEKDAHAWSEIWLDSHGWVRMDPATVFARDGGEIDGWGLGEGQSTEQDDAGRENSGADDPALEARTFKTGDAGSFRARSASESEPRVGWWSRWITGLNAEAQITLLESVSLDGSWRNLVLLAGGVLSLLALTMAAVRLSVRCWQQRQLPTADRMAGWAARTLGGAAHPAEAFRTCLSRYAVDLTPAMQARLESLARELSAARYGGNKLAADWGIRWKTTLREARDS